MDKNEKFESDNLIYRGISAEDTKLIVDWRNQNQDSQYFNNPIKLSYESHLEWLELYKNNQSRYDFIISLKKSFKPIGTVGIKNISSSGCQVSYMIGDISQRRKGLAKEALQCITKKSLDLGMKDIVATVHKNNTASYFAAIHSGFKIFKEYGDFIILKYEPTIILKETKDI